ncbi:MAG TPA: FGGY family carbohydrate kinase [Solirubrobacteraceae bacterium]|nr:FGGY family carbohydrate kinase [Solirubrobacteraceae bacterium]
MLVAIDAGTTGARAVAVDLDGRVLHEARHAYPTAAPRPGWAEQDARDWRGRALDALAELREALGGARPEAIGLTGQCPTVAPVDERGDPVGPGLLYRDNRATAQARAMRERFGVEAMHARTGHVATAFHVGPKVLWMREHAPDVFAAAARFAHPRDVVLRALTGADSTDETAANATVFFDLRARDWAHDMLEAFGLASSQFPAVLAPWEVAGRLDDGTPVVIGAADSQCAAYGSGVSEPGPFSEMAGASSCLNSIVHEPLSEPRVTHYSHVTPGVYCTEIGLNTTGAAVRWAVEQLRFESFAELDERAARVHGNLRAGGGDARAVAPLFLPYLGDGERDDPALRAGFVGVTDRHGRDELAYAVLEGVALGIEETLAVLTGAGAPLDELRVAGGLTRMRALGPIKADVVGVPVVHLEADTAAVGAAMLAAAAAGHGDAADAAIAGLVARAARFEPHPSDALAARREWFRAVRASAAVRVEEAA